MAYKKKTLEQKKKEGKPCIHIPKHLYSNKEEYQALYQEQYYKKKYGRSWAEFRKQKYEKKNPPGTLHIVVAEVVPKTRDHLERTPRKSRRTLYPFNFKNSSPFLVTFEDASDNNKLAKIVSDNFGEGHYQVRFPGRGGKGVVYRTVMDVVVHESDEVSMERTWRIVNVREKRLNQYHFRRNTKKEQNKRKQERFS